MMSNICDLLLSDAFTIYLAFSGILLSLITLLYSFIIGKRSELELCAEASKFGQNNPLMKKKQSNLIRQIKNISKINKKVFIVLLLSLKACVISWVSIRFVSDNYYVSSLCLIGFLTLLIAIIMIKMVWELYLQYKNDIKL